MKNDHFDRRGDSLGKLTKPVSSSLMVAPVPAYSPIVARIPITIREAAMGDLPFIDRLQKQQSRELGFLPFKALEGKIELGQVLVAVSRCEFRDASSGTNARGEIRDASSNASQLESCISNLETRSETPLGYLIAADRYLHRDELGYITQINIVPEARRSLVAAQLLQAQFDRSALGCRLYCCWCAQDLAANRFWESMGFTAIAFRNGSDKATKRRSDGGESHSVASSLGRSVASRRVHLFWQKRIRAGDTTTPFWYPSATGSGQMRADRLVFPIPAGMHWSEVGPIEIEGERVEKTPRGKKAMKGKPKIRSPHSRNGGGGGRLWFMKDAVKDLAAKEETAIEPMKTPLARKPSIDPTLKRMARTLRDQWFERTAAGDRDPALTQARHDVKRLAA